MLNILHVSDLHFGPPWLPRVGQALLEIAPRLEPDVVVISGDLTQRARREQFAESTGIEGLYSVGRNGEFGHWLMEDVYWRTRRRIRPLLDKASRVTL